MKIGRLFPQVILVLMALWPLWANGSTDIGVTDAAKNDVVWTSLGKDENDSMPLGNGDIGLNVWTETNGDIVLLAAKGDAWSENGQLLKLSRLRIKLSPNPFLRASHFSQILKLETAELILASGATTVRIWVDANRPAAHVEVHSNHSLQAEAILEVWRTQSHPFDPTTGGTNGALRELFGCPFPITRAADVILPEKDNRLSVCHFNASSIYPMILQQEHLDSLRDKYADPLFHSCSGLGVWGPGWIAQDNNRLVSPSSCDLDLDLFALTQKVSGPEVWSAELNKIITQNKGTSIETARAAHQSWWAQFWNRSWVHLNGTGDAAKVSQGYAMQRYLDACAGRSVQPIKFNGSIFTVGHDLPNGDELRDNQHNPDFRAWGSCYWNQNNRLIYWPLLATGDYDLLQPWFDMYVKALPLLSDRTQMYYRHHGAYFPETFYFWMLPAVADFGWNNQANEMENPYIRYHTQGGLEVIAQMLDYLIDTEDRAFAHDKLLPMADSVLTYYDQHWRRASNGKIIFFPDQALETYQTGVINPTPDIAGLKSDLSRLLALPETLTTPEERTTWNRLQDDLPEVPQGMTASGKLPPRGKGDPDAFPTLLPAQKYEGAANSENPELYCIFPYRIYGVGKPNLDLARQAYAARLFPRDTGWGQDGMEASFLGLTEEARQKVVREFTDYGSHFSWFWASETDWLPNVENGGCGMMTLQTMLMQCDGRRIQLLPAWPPEWSADFKLHAPYNTIVEGHVEHGEITRLQVTPEARTGDVVIVLKK